MKKSAKEGLYVLGLPNSVLVAETDGLGVPCSVYGVSSYLNLDSGRSVFEPVLDLVREKSKKGFMMGVAGVSHPAFNLHAHHVEVTLRAKAPEYFPNIIKSEMKITGDDYFFHVIGAATGLEYNSKEEPETDYVVVGIDPIKLAEIQDDMVLNGLVPHRIECVSLAMLPLLTKALAKEDGDRRLLVLEIHQDSCLVTMVTQEGQYTFRTIHRGERAMCQAIKDEINQKDEDAARKLLYSETFDLSDLGPTIIKGILREVSAITGYYEVETGQSVGHLYVPSLPPSQNWIVELLAHSMGVDVLRMDPKWVCSELGIQVDSSVKLDSRDARLPGLFAIMGRH